VQVDARILHALGASSEGENRWWSIAMYNRGKELYFFIHHGKLSSIICLLMNRFGALIRMVAHALALRKIKVKMFWRVLTAPISGPTLPEDAKTF
jgi:GT2 family glycosyltransferase